VSARDRNRTPRPAGATLLEVEIPGFEGIAVTRRKRISVRSVNLPIILVTRLGDLESKVRGLDMCVIRGAA
jgi:DNA-binding response OmpR family regulator